MKRKHPRYGTKGQVYIASIENPEVFLKNLSASGLCLESKGFMGVVPKSRYSIDIVPENESFMDKFSLEIESRWIRTGRSLSESGFVIIIPKGKKGSLKEYLEFLDSQSEPLD